MPRGKLIIVLFLVLAQSEHRTLVKVEDELIWRAPGRPEARVGWVDREEHKASGILGSI